MHTESTHSLHVGVNLDVCYISVGAGQPALAHKFNKSRGRLVCKIHILLCYRYCLPTSVKFNKGKENRWKDYINGYLQKKKEAQ